MSRAKKPSIPRATVIRDSAARPRVPAIAPDDYPTPKPFGDVYVKDKDEHPGYVLLEARHVQELTSTVGRVGGIIRAGESIQREQLVVLGQILGAIKDQGQAIREQGEEIKELRADVNKLLAELVYKIGNGRDDVALAPQGETP